MGAHTRSINVVGLYTPQIRCSANNLLFLQALLIGINQSSAQTYETFGVFVSKSHYICCY